MHYFGAWSVFLWCSAMLYAADRPQREHFGGFRWVIYCNCCARNRKSQQSLAQADDQPHLFHKSRIDHKKTRKIN
ncbi:hypothetical protein, partial [Buttiauxella warmboldiae]|uniref:hypothetical protein n=1 Tax=Buttiauxella warmboldiae TaxID=82993 RepID=UPI001ABFC09F